MSDRDTKEKVMELLKPNFGLWTIDQQMKANEVSKTYIKNLKRHFRQKGADPGELTTIDLNILNLS